MRIIAGKYAKRRLHTLKSMATRPTSDKVKESLFNSLGQFFTGGIVLDLYAGSGALGIEAVSRGFDQAILVDKSHAACQVIQQNITACDPKKFTLLHMPANKALKLLAEKNLQFNLIFLDPPYAQEKIANDMQQLTALDLLAQGAIVVAENDEHTVLGPIDGFTLVKKHQLGRTVLRTYRKND